MLFSVMGASDPLVGYTASTTLINNDSVTPCDPTVGKYSAQWSFIPGLPSTILNGTRAMIEYSLDGGFTWIIDAASVDASLGFYDGDLSGVVGFTSLDNTRFRLTIYNGQARLSGTPIVFTPPFSCPY